MCIWCSECFAVEPAFYIWKLPVSLTITFNWDADNNLILWGVLLYTLLHQASKLVAGLLLVKVRAW